MPVSSLIGSLVIELIDRKRPSMSEKRTNPYHKVIEILTSGPINYQGMVHMLAKHFPAVFVKVVGMLDHSSRIIKHESYEVDTTAPWYKEAREIATRPYTDGIRSGKIGAIKLVREKTGMGLKEAKDFVEKYLI
jgi:hypothetical protein